VNRRILGFLRSTEKVKNNRTENRRTVKTTCTCALIKEMEHCTENSFGRENGTSRPCYHTALVIRMVYRYGTNYFLMKLLY
jgi:hypothetical protein